MIRSLTLLLIFFSGFAGAQDAMNVLPQQKPWMEQDAACVFPAGTIPGNMMDEISTNAAIYLKNALPDLKNNNVTLVLTHKVESNYARYFDFEQKYGDYEIFGSAIKIGLDKENHILSIVSKTAPVANWPGIMTINQPDPARLKLAIGECDNYTWKQQWFYTENAGIPAFIVNCDKNDGSRNEIMALNANYEILYQHSLIKHFMAPDSMVKMFVFYPDPLTSAKVPYGSPYINHNDSDVAVLDSQMQGKDIKVNFANNSFTLESEYVRVSDIASPHTITTIETRPVFHYHRDTSAFRDIMIYYHINNYRAHMKSIGFDSLGHHQIVVDADGLYDDNSNFEHNGADAKIYFGIGGIPDAEDADVPIHEYSHFISFSACPGCSEFGTEREALDEGLADYFAASYSKAISTYNWQKIYNWDGNVHNWPGRSVAVGDHYPDALKTGDIHLEGQMWSSALMQIWDTIGRDKTDILMLETMYSLGKYLNMMAAAKLFIKTDSLIYKGADAAILAHYFIKRGFLPVEYLGIAPAGQQTGYKVVTGYFASTGKVLFDFDTPQTGDLILTDITGREIARQAVIRNDQVVFTSPGLSSGVYILTVNTSGLHKSFKLLH